MWWHTPHCAESFTVPGASRWHAAHCSLAVGAEQREMSFLPRDRNSTAASRSANGSFRTSCRARLCARPRANGSRCRSNGARPNASVEWHCAQLTTRCRPSSGKFGEVVIEGDLRSPARLRRDRSRIRRLQLAAVRILAAMAADAVLGELLSGGNAGVADVAVDLGVRTHQGKLVSRPHDRMSSRAAIDRCRGSPRTCRRSGRRGHRRPGGSRCSPSESCPCSYRAVTGEAVDFRVHAEQLVAGLLQVVEFRGLPLLRHVALGAIRHRAIRGAHRPSRDSRRSSSASACSALPM